MLQHRVIPILLVDSGGLVKTRQFRDPVYLGDPLNAIRIFSEKEVDELALIDISASRDGKEPDWELVEEVAGECFMPLSYGGGIRTFEQAKRLFRLGVEKVIVQSAALDDLSLVSRIAQHAGNQSVAVAIDVTRKRFGRRGLWRSARKQADKRSWLEFIVDCQTAGAGEVVLTSVTHEGEMAGLDLELVAEASSVASVPLVAHGGVGSFEDIKAGVAAGADAVAAGSFFVFRSRKRGILISYPEYSELETHMGRGTNGQLDLRAWERPAIRS